MLLSYVLEQFVSLFPASPIVHNPEVHTSLKYTCMNQPELKPLKMSDLQAHSVPASFSVWAVQFHPQVSSSVWDWLIGVKQNCEKKPKSLLEGPSLLGGSALGENISGKFCERAKEYHLSSQLFLLDLKSQGQSSTSKHIKQFTTAEALSQHTHPAPKNNCQNTGSDSPPE